MGKKGRKRGTVEVKEEPLDMPAGAAVKLEVKDEPVATVKAEVKEEGVSQADGLTDMERARAAVIAENRRRMLALGIPSLVKELGGTAGRGGKGGAKPTAKRAKREVAHPQRGASAADEAPSRRSSRLQEAAEHPKPQPETAEERFVRELGEFVVEGACPRCGKVMETGPKAQKAHLLDGAGRPEPTGAKAARIRPSAPRPRASDADVLAVRGRAGAGGACPPPLAQRVCPPAP